jgi:predicted DNA-binding transcriptional regulator YafY
MRYRTGRTGDETTRCIDPYKVWYHSGALYVIGLDHRSNEIRTFSVDRIQSIERTEDAFIVDADFDFDAYTASSFGVVADPAVAVRIRFTADWASYVEEREWHASQSTQPLPDGRLELKMEVGATRELANWILSFGGGAEVVEPASLREEVKASLEAALANYRQAT